MCIDPVWKTYMFRKCDLIIAGCPALFLSETSSWEERRSWICESVAPSATQAETLVICSGVSLAIGTQSAGTSGDFQASRRLIV